MNDPIEITEEERRFLMEIARRGLPYPKVTVTTKNGDIAVTTDEKERLDVIAKRQGMAGAADLINYVL